jgi:F0F1-type ATP synthase membrane subunit b/b'
MRPSLAVFDKGALRMSAFNLTPNPAVMLAQAGVLITTIVVVKKLYVEPYLRVRSKRESLTAGNKSQAEEILKKNADLTMQITSKISAAHSENQNVRQELMNKASQGRQRIVEEAERVARKSVEDARSQIKQDLAAAQSTLPDIVRQVANTVYQEALR